MILPIGDQPNPKGVPWVNYLLLGVNVAVFLGLTLPRLYSFPSPNDPATLELLRRLSLQHPEVPVDELARQLLRGLSAYDVFLTRWGYRPGDPSLVTLFSSMFLHGGWLHLLGNMLFLWIYGDNVEHRLGPLGYLVAYLATGAVAAIGYGLIVPAADRGIPMVGASGAISGVLGFYFIWFPRNKVRLLIFLFPIFVFTWLVSARLVLGFYLIVENLLPFLLGRGGERGGGVAYGAHLGGFLAGIASALVFDRVVAWWCARRGCAEFNQAARQRGTSSPEAGAGGPEPARLGAEGVEARRERDPEGAVARYLGLLPSERRQVPVETVAELADRLAPDRPDAALALYRQALVDHPRGPGLDRIFLGIGLALLRGKRRPTAAYQYLMDALDAGPSPEVEAAAREALDEIARLQKLQISSRRR
jgi:membrane associated rhomboid family serine protease